MALEKVQRGDIWVLTPKKDLMGGDETAELEQAIRSIGTEGTPRIVIDFARVSYMNSTGLGMLVSAHMACRNREGVLRLANISKRINNVFLITKLAFVFDTFDSVEEAVAGVNRSDPKAGQS